MYRIGGVLAEAKGKGADTKAVPVWLITPDRQLRTEITGHIRRAHDCRIEGVYGRWQCAMPVFASLDDEKTKVVVLDEDPGSRNGNGCLSFLKSLGGVFSTVVLMNEPTDNNLASALAHGVSGFIVKPAAADEIVVAVEAVARGEVWMKRQILDRIASLVPHVMMEKSSGLTAREQEIVSLAIEGQSTKMIADKLNISYYTVDTHIKNIYQKLKVNNRSGLVSLVLQTRGW